MDKITTAAKPIVFISHFTGGGSAVSLLTLVQHLDRSWLQPAVVFHRIKNPAFVASLEQLGIPTTSLTTAKALGEARARQQPAGGSLAKYRAWPGYDLYRSLKSGGRALQRDRRWLPGLIQHLRQMRPLLVHCNNGLRDHSLDILACARLGIPVVCHVRNFEAVTTWERWVARFVRRFIYISRAVGADYERQGIPAGRGVVIHDAVATEAMAQPAPLPRATFGLGPENIVVANVGRLVRWKGQDVFLRAIARLASKYPNLRALVVGGPDDNASSRAFADELDRLAQELGLGAQVIFTGHQPAAHRLMATADIVVHSSTTPEPLGLVVLEGMACGKPVIASAAGGVLDVVSDNVNGLLFKLGDDEALAAALDRLLAHPQAALRLAEAGRLHVADHFSGARHAAQVMAVYRDCLTPDSLNSRRAGPVEFRAG